MNRKFYHAALILLLTIASVGQAQSPPAGFTSTTLSDQWNEVVGLTFNAPGTHMFVWERPGRVWVVANTQRTLLLDISPEVGAWNDHGLLGFALHPQFETNGYFYLFYVVDRHHLLHVGTPGYNPATNDYFSATIGRLTRYTATKTGGNYSVDPASRKVLLGATTSTGVPSLARSHVTGGILFGADGTLLVATGDGASGSTPDFGSNAGTYYAQALADGILTPKENVGSFRAQLIDCLSGKILRLDPETGAGIPSNPFYTAGNPQAPRSKVWAVGFRNPFRLTRKPGTGSTDPTAANPGTLYVGDVGFLDWEEIDVVSKPRQNLGWPLFEGLEANATFTTQKRYNLDAPNPAYGVNGCTQEYFYFQDLVRQATPTGTATFVNPCTGQALPSSVYPFVHSRPLLDWKHGSGPSRTGIFSGGLASVINLGAPGSPVAGPQFGGSADVGGVFYPHADFPVEYRNTYFFGDYAGGWLRNMTVDDNNTPSVVRDFVSSGSIAVGMAVHPTEPGLYYANFPSEIRKITYQSANRPPVAAVTSDKSYGAGPLSVQFTGSASSDPDGQALSYSWDFGDGTTSTLANPLHTFQPPSAAPTPYTVRLVVKDPLGLASQASLLISVNNTPPQVTITSPTNNALYSILAETTFPLKATVTDQEHSTSQLRYQWQGFLHHAEHNHPEPIQTTPEGSLTTAPEGCGAETYYYRVVLTVTDSAGLATTQEIRLNPDCSTAPAYTFYRAINLGGSALTLDGNAWEGATAPNYTTDGKASNKPTVPLLPATDAARSGMIRSFVYKLGRLTTTVSALPPGKYRVWTYVWEDNTPEVVSLALNGQTVVSNYNTGPAGTWSKLGPFEVTLAATGSVQLTSSGGTLNLSGLELWRANGTPPPPGNQAPLANAGPDQTLTLPTNSTSLAGSGTDADGTISTFAWSQVSGPSQASFNSSTSAQPTVSGLVAGSYIFSLIVQDNAGATSAADQVSITVSPATPPPTGTYTFYRGINLNGPALTLDGNPWQASASAPNFTTTGTGFSNTSVALQPATDATRTAMIRSSVYRLAGLTATLSAVPAGQYRVWVYVWEDNNAEVYSLALNGQTVLANHNSGPAGTWSKLGPFDVSAPSGTLQLTTSGGTANLSGLEVWKSSSTGTPTNQPPLANAGPDKALSLPANSTMLQGSGTDADGTITFYSWSQSSGPNTATFTSKTIANPTISGLIAGSYVFHLTVQDNAGASSSPDQVTVLVSGSSTPPAGSATLVALGASWKYLDTGANLGTAWRNLFDDASWKTGNAEFGYGDGDEATLVHFGPNTSQKYATTYFRKTIDLANPSAFSTYTAQLRRDDGAVVYVNGQEVFRSNLPAGTVGYQALASLAADDGQTLLSFPVPASVWQTGSNVVAVEIHQATFNSSDLSFDLAITATGAGSAARPLATASRLSNAPAFGIYPNPSPTGQYVLEFPAALGNQLTYTLFSPLGQRITQGTLPVSKGSTRTNLDLSEVALATGVYYLRLSGAGQPLQYKLLR